MNPARIFVIMNPTLAGQRIPFEGDSSPSLCSGSEWRTVFLSFWTRQRRAKNSIPLSFWRIPWKFLVPTLVSAVSGQIYARKYICREQHLNLWNFVILNLFQDLIPSKIPKWIRNDKLHTFKLRCLQLANSEWHGRGIKTWSAAGRSGLGFAGLSSHTQLYEESGRTTH